MQSNHSSGNVLFLILIAVVLFAALSYAVTSSSRSGGNVDKEKNELAISNLMQQLTLLDQSIMRLKILNKCTDKEISFENTTVSGYSFATRDKCKLFEPQGGGLNWLVPVKKVGESNYRYNHRNWVLGQGCSGSTNCTDLIMMWRNIPDDLCLAINKKMLDIDLTTIPSNSNSMDDLDYYNGSRSPNGRIYVSALNRGKTGCFKKTSSTSNIFFYTLIKY